MGRTSEKLKTSLGKIFRFLTTKKQRPAPPVADIANVADVILPIRVPLRKRMTMPFKRITFWAKRKKDETLSGVTTRQRVKRYNAVRAEKGDR